jgi:hypothetical protein
MAYIVTASTSVVLVDTSILTAGQTAVVLLSSQVPSGRNVTIRDSLGFLSSPQSIVISTTNGISFTDGTSRISISNPYAFLTVSSRDANTWNVVNTFAFPLSQTVANVQSLTTSTLYGANVYIGSTLTTGQIYSQSFAASSTSQVLGPLFVSTLVVGVQPDQQIPYETTPGYSAYIIGNSYISSNVYIGGNVSVGGSGLFGSTVLVQGSLNVSTGATVTGDLNVIGGINAFGAGYIQCQNLVVQSTMNVLGFASFNSNIAVQSNVQIGGSLTTTTLQTSSVQIVGGVTGYIQLGAPTGPVIQSQGSGIVINNPIYTTLLSTQNAHIISDTSTNTLTVLSTFSGTGISQFLLSSATIQNENGSLVTSSIQTNTLQVAYAVGTSIFTASSFTTSSCVIQGSVQTLSPTAFVSTGYLYTSSMDVNFVSTGSITIGQIQTPSIQVSSLIVYRNIVCNPGVSTITMTVATIDNSQGSLYTGALFTSSISASSLTFQSGQITSANPFIINSPNTYFQTANTSSMIASTIQTSSFTTTMLTIGTSTLGGNGPNLLYSTIGGPSTNMYVSGGPGDYLTPYFLSNVVPAGQNPTQPYTSYINFQGNNLGIPGSVIGYTANFFWGGQINSQMTIANGASFYGAAQADQTFSGTINASSFTVNSYLYGNSRFSITFNYTYNQSATYITSNNVLEFNSGRLNWKYALNGTTIQNSLNDMSIRNIYYYGSLNFASDPRVKTDIEEADLKRCYDTINSMPLRKYKYRDDYCSTFQIGDTRRLGFLATDLLPHFPKSVHTSDSVFPALSTPLMTIDTSQVEMAHLGATKYLMAEVERLERILSSSPALKYANNVE